MAAGGTTSSGLRADAERNRQLIVAAAHSAFAADGIDVSMAEVARQAGVGFATAQRRFPTKESLIAEVVREQLAGIGEIRPAENDENSDPWEAFASPLRACCAHQAAEPGLAGAMTQLLAVVSDPTVGAPVAAHFEKVSARAKAAGLLRPDTSLDDILIILKANAGVVANSRGCEAQASRRFVELALRSLRANGTAARSD